MPKIRNMGSSTMKFNEGIVASGSVAPMSTTGVADAAIHTSGSILLSSEDEVNLDIEVQSKRPRVVLRSHAGTNNPAIVMDRSFDGGGGFAAVRSGDTLSQVDSNGYDGSSFVNAASIKVVADGTPGSNDMPGRIELRTTPGGASAVVTRMTIKNNGHVGIGTANPLSELDVSGSIAITKAISTPSQPAVDQGYLYTKSDGKLYWRSSALAETDLTAASGGGGGGSGDNLTVTSPKTGNYTASNWEFVLVNLAGASGDVTVTLPAASADKQVAIKINSQAMGKEVIVDGNGSETIDGLTTRILNTDYESIHLISDGSNWWRIS